MPGGWEGLEGEEAQDGGGEQPWRTALVPGWGDPGSEEFGGDWGSGFPGRERELCHQGVVEGPG